MTEMIIVACKLPHGLHLDFGGQRITLKGALSSPELTKLFITPDESVGLTKVPVDFWEAWVEKNKDFPPLKKGFIFAHKKKKSIEKEAEEKKDLKTGLERIDPKNPPRGVNKNVEQIAAGQTE